MVADTALVVVNMVLVVPVSEVLVWAGVLDMMFVLCVVLPDVLGEAVFMVVLVMVEELKIVVAVVEALVLAVLSVVWDDSVEDSLESVAEV